MFSLQQQYVFYLDTNDLTEATAKQGDFSFLNKNKHLKQIDIKMLYSIYGIHEIWQVYILIKYV